MAPTPDPAPPAARGGYLRSLEQLEELTGRRVAAADRGALAQVLDRYPVRLSEHLVELVRRSPAVAAQFLPDPREVTSSSGERHCFVGLLPTGVPGVERMYPDRCVLMPTSTCPAFCRFCFRKFNELRAAPPRSIEELDQALEYVAARPELREVLITGGEPAMDRRRLAHLMAGLRQIDHVGPIRVACRSLVTCPGLIDGELVRLLGGHQDLSSGRPVEVASHINHPDEITPATTAALAALRGQGVHVYNQAVLLRGINDDAGVLRRLLWRLRLLGVEIYALYIGEPVLGMDHLRVSMQEALRLKEALRRMASGRSNPRLILTTRVGKVELGLDGQVVDREADGRHAWIRTPYTMEGFRRRHAGFQLPAGARLDERGRIEVRYLDGPGLAEPAPPAGEHC